jgi:hypothetical protein
MLPQHKNILANVTDENESQTNGSISNSKMSSLQASDISEGMTTNISNIEDKHKCYASVLSSSSSKRNYTSLCVLC